MARVMVELQRGYGDGYGVIEIAADGNLIPTPGVKVKTYSDGFPMEPWRQRILAGPAVTLIDGGVKVPESAIVRIIGPLDCPEASRIRARRYTKNWQRKEFVSLATDAEIASAMSADSEPQVYEAMTALRAKYASCLECGAPAGEEHTCECSHA